MKFSLLLVAALAVFAVPSFARTMDRCSLAREMYSLGTPKSELAIWTCIAQYESSYRTNVVGPTNSNGSNDYGLFQVNDYYWCTPPSGKFSYNECKTTCNSLLTDNISASVTCARKVKSQQGWTAWSVYKPKCSGSLPSIDSCF